MNSHPRGLHSPVLPTVMLVAIQFTQRGRPLARPPEFAAEIKRLSALNPTDLRNGVRREGSQLTLETLAHFVRIGGGGGDPELSDAAARHLLEGSRRIANSVLKVLRSTDREDARSEVIRDMLISLTKADGEGPTYWEQRFGHAYRQRCIDAVRRRRTGQEEATDSLEDAPEHHNRPDPTDLAAEVAIRIDRHQLKEIVAELSDEQARAVTLRWFKNLPVSGPGSVAEIMGISRQMVYRHLRNAYRVLKMNPRFRALLEP